MNQKSLKDEFNEDLAANNYRLYLADKVGHIIKKARKEANLTQAALADKLDINRVTLARYESGDILPKSDKIAKLCELFPDYYPIFTDVLASENTRLETRNAMHQRTEEYLLKFTNLFWRMCIEESDCNPIDWIVTKDNAAKWIIEKNDTGVSYLVDEDDMTIFFDRLIQHLKIEFIPFLEEKGITDYQQLLAENDVELDKNTDDKQD